MAKETITRLSNRIEKLELAFGEMTETVKDFQNLINDAVEEKLKSEPILRKFKWPDERFEDLWNTLRCTGIDISDCSGCSDGIEARCNAYDVYILAKKFTYLKEEVESND